MSSSDIAIAVRGLSKAYTIRHGVEDHNTLAEMLLARVRQPFRRATRETFWALKDVSFEIKKGESVGIVGRNGAGKSTMFKLLSRITEPTGGEIDLYGRLASLLEVGTGFHPELTGRENIYLYGAILGMRRPEIARQFDAIVDFAGVEQFLDTPVKRYSSGMYVRLAFAVAAHLEAEILLVDEVLAVGDAAFQKRCLGKMTDLAQSGRTVAFVSHNMQAVAALCNRVILLNSGTVERDGDPKSVIAAYLTRTASSDGVSTRRPGSGQLRFTSIAPTAEHFTCADPKEVRFTLQAETNRPQHFQVACHIIDERGSILLQCDSSLVCEGFDADEQINGRFVLRTPWLRPGRYRVDFFCFDHGIIDSVEHACTITVLPVLPYSQVASEGSTRHGAVFADFSYELIDQDVPTGVGEGVRVLSSGGH